MEHIFYVREAGIAYLKKDKIKLKSRGTTKLWMNWHAKSVKTFIYHL